MLKGDGFLEELEKKLRLAADSCGFANFRDRLGELLEGEAELREEFLKEVAGGVETGLKEEKSRKDERV